MTLSDRGRYFIVEGQIGVMTNGGFAPPHAVLAVCAEEVDPPATGYHLRKFCVQNGAFWGKIAVFVIANKVQF